MIPLSVAEIVEATRGKLIKGSPDGLIQGVSIDSRTVSVGDLFIPLKGNTDGHHYLFDAIKNGAKGFLAEKNGIAGDEFVGKTGEAFVVEVADTLKALQDIAGFYRDRMQAKVVGITGSTGKTTTKDMITCVLAQNFKVVSTDKNYNNEIGVPLTILSANEDTEVLVVEMAMRGSGQIKELTGIAKPDIGVLTNIGQAHIELLGSEKAIAEAKAELVEAIPEHGTVVLNADDLWTPFVTECACSKIITYGITEGDIRADKIEADELGRAKFRLTVYGGDGYTVRLPVPGRHNTYNALAAAAVAVELGLNADQIRIGLSSCKLSAMRMEVFSTGDNVIILNDAYNANPTSMQAALATLMDVETEGRRVAVLGDMLELGVHTNEAHKHIGGVAASLGVDALVTVGIESQVLAESAIRSGMNPKTVVTCVDADTASEVLKQLIEPGDVVLVKASRAVGLEVVVRALVKL